jgi:hypothetical protein
VALKKGDVLDEFKRHSHACGLVVKVMGGGEGFEKVVCCGHALTEEDLVPDVATARGRKKGSLPPAVVLDEKKLYQNSCRFRVMIIDGGSGFTEIRCCGHSLTASLMRDFNMARCGDLNQTCQGWREQPRGILKKTCQFRSRVTQRLNVPKHTPLRSLPACAYSIPLA